MIPFNRERLTQLMRAHKADVILATTRHNVRYLTGGYYLPFYARASRFGGGQYISIVGIPADHLESAFYVGRGRLHQGVGSVLDLQPPLDRPGGQHVGSRG